MSIFLVSSVIVIFEFRCSYALNSKTPARVLCRNIEEISSIKKCPNLNANQYPFSSLYGCHVQDHIYNNITRLSIHQCSTAQHRIFQTNWVKATANDAMTSGTFNSSLYDNKPTGYCYKAPSDKSASINPRKYTTFGKILVSLMSLNGNDRKA